jgi:hypothetical protein
MSPVYALLTVLILYLFDAATKGILRQDAIRSLTAFVESGKLITSQDIKKDTTAILVIVSEHTRGFRETNVNIMKAIIQLILAICDIHNKVEVMIDTWTVNVGTSVAAQKISDRKASDACKNLLSSLCIVAAPYLVILEGFKCLNNNKSPLAHEEYLNWIVTFCGEFGAMSIGPHVIDLIPYLFDEIAAPNPKVKRAGFNATGILYSHIGGQLQALVLSLAKPSVRMDLKSCFDEHPFDELNQRKDWPKVSLHSAQEIKGSTQAAFTLSVPKVLLSTELGEDVMLKLGSKDGKTAWRQRKESLEEIDAAFKRCNGMLETEGSAVKYLIDLSRALRDRLSDTQINLKPIAAGLIGGMLSMVDMPTQAKLGKVVFGPLINAAVNDIKKAMRDACLNAMRLGTKAADLDGGSLNQDALEAFVVAFVSEINEASTRAGGLPDVLEFLLSVAESLPNLDQITSTRGLPLGEKYASAIVECLTSSKSDTRIAATLLLGISLDKNVVGLGNIRKAAEKLKPAQQRTIGPVVAKLAKQRDTSSVASYSIEISNENDAQNVTATRNPTENGRGVHLLVVKQSFTRGVEENEASSPFRKAGAGSPHPLVARGHSVGQTSSKAIIWPEYPELLHGTVLFNNLHKVWSPLLPPLSAAALFPDGGIIKQDDAKGGCAVISRAITVDRSENDNAVKAQLDLIFRWLAYVLSSKESTAGLQGILNVISDLLSLLIERKQLLSESTAMLLLPYLFEFASSAKGRFQEQAREILVLSENPNLLSAKQLGSSVCVAVIDRSLHAKARLLGCQTCLACVRSDGLEAIGKRGVLAAARALSDESIADNKTSALDLVEATLLKMNGDIQRFVRICGPNLSDKARVLLEERWSKRDRREDRPSNETSEHQSTLTADDKDDKTFLDDELPPFRSRTDGLQQLAPKVRRSIDPTKKTKPGTVYAQVANSGVHDTGIQNESGAADLRARLLKIREKRDIPDILHDTETMKESDMELTYSTDSQDMEIFYEGGVVQLTELVSLTLPILDDSLELQAAVETLKKFHAALSKQQTSLPGLSTLQLSRLRQLLLSHLSGTIGYLSKLIGFSFKCGYPEFNSGISIPLLSVCLASLMALFRDPDVSAAVEQAPLTILVRETGTALLDARLSTSSGFLPEATTTQMVRAFNRLSVQAATGAARHVALMALMDLLQSASLVDPDTLSSEKHAFDSRLSRLLSKLFMRVIKAEEAASEPFNPNSVDLEAILCSMEDFLNTRHTTGNLLGSSDVCTGVMQSLADALIRARGVKKLRSIMKDLDIGPVSLLASFIQNIEGTDGDKMTFTVSEHVALNVSSPQKVSTMPLFKASRSLSLISDVSTDAAALVSALASSNAGPEREAALEALRQYKLTHGDDGLIAHLQEVSSPFRAFIEQQIAGAEGLASTTKKVEEENIGSMSERLNSLRSRLGANESTTSTPKNEPTATKLLNATNDSPTGTILNATRVSSMGTSTKQTQSVSAASHIPSSIASHRSLGSRLAKSTPSKLAQPSPSKLSSTSTLRERLEASQMNRRVLAGPNEVSTSLGRAAALRARLEAVKQKNRQFD